MQVLASTEKMFTARMVARETILVSTMSLRDFVFLLWYESLLQRHFDAPLEFGPHVNGCIVYSG